MKLLSFTVPCYNSEDYMETCLESLLAGGEDVEIIIVDDGSTDRTAEIADSYAERYPSVVRVIHKENGGHGSGVNAGIAAAAGLFFKVVDSDDKVDAESYRQILDFLEESVRESREPDMLVSNYVYDKAGARHKFVMKPHGLPRGKLIGWSDVRHIRKYHYMLMHSIIYRTELLRECGLKLPEHTFYVDNIYAFYPLPYVQSIYYLDVDFYRYYIGREDQSVSEKNLIKRIDQYIQVAEIMVRQYSGFKAAGAEPACLHYMMNYMEIIMAIVFGFLDVGGTKENSEKKARMWEMIQKTDPELARELKHRFSLIITNLPGKTGSIVESRVYHIAKKIFGFN